MKLKTKCICGRVVDNRSRRQPTPQERAKMEAMNPYDRGRFRASLRYGHTPAPARRYNVESADLAEFGETPRQISPGPTRIVCKGCRRTYMVEGYDARLDSAIIRALPEIQLTQADLEKE